MSFSKAVRVTDIFFFWLISIIYAVVPFGIMKSTGLIDPKHCAALAFLIGVGFARLTLHRK